MQKHRNSLPTLCTDMLMEPSLKSNPYTSAGHDPYRHQRRSPKLINPDAEEFIPQSKRNSRRAAQRRRTKYFKAMKKNGNIKKDNRFHRTPPAGRYASLEQRTLDSFARSSFMMQSQPSQHSPRSMASFEMMNQTHCNEMHIDLNAMAMNKSNSLVLQEWILKAKAYENISQLKFYFMQLVPNVVRLSKNQYGNFVIQRLIENSSFKMIDSMIKNIGLDLFEMATDEFACRVLQKLLKYCSDAQRDQLVTSLLREVNKLLDCRFGSYVLQVVIEVVPSDKLEVLTNEHFIPKIMNLCHDQYGSHILQHAYRFYKKEDTTQLTERIMENLIDFCQDQHANYVVQKMIYYGDKNIQNRAMEKMMPHICKLVVTKSGSNVIEECLQVATEEQCSKMLAAMTHDEETLYTIVSDQFGNYVIQKMLKRLPYVHKQKLRESLQELFKSLERKEIKLKNYAKFVLQIIDPKFDVKKGMKKQNAA